MTGHYRAGGCGHDRAGIVRSFGPEGAHAATDVCGDLACVDAATAWAASITGEPADYRPDPLEPQ